MPYMLFPHTQINESDLTKILKRFGGLTICQPWFMETPVPDIKQTDITGVHIQNPATALKPKEDFSTLLSEYRSVGHSKLGTKVMETFWVPPRKESSPRIHHGKSGN